MSETSAPKQKKTEVPKLSKKQVRAYIVDIEKKIAEREGADMASLIAINHLLSLPNAEKLLDDELRKQLKDLWQKLKADGVQVDEPPLLFGLPEGFGEDDIEDEEELSLGAAEQAASKKLPTPKKPAETPAKPVQKDIAIPEEDQELPH